MNVASVGTTSTSSSRRASSTPTAAPSWRLFVALTLPEALRQQVAATQHTLRQAHRALERNIRWVNPDSAHLTLHFLGATPSSLVPTITDQLAHTLVDAPALPLTVGGVGTFPGAGSPRVLWLGVDGADDTLLALTHLANGVRTAVANVMDAETGHAAQAPFRAHITLGRARSGYRIPPTAVQQALLAPAVTENRTPWHAERVELIRSLLDGNGPIYTPLAHWQLPDSHRRNPEHG